MKICYSKIIMTRLLKIFIFTFAFSLLAFVSPSPAKATQFMDAMTAPGMNLQKYIIGEDAIKPGGTQGMTTALANGLSTMMLGSYDENGNRLASGGVNIVADLTNNLYNTPPVSGVRYLAYMGSRLHLVSPAFAATPGQDFLKPMIDIWILNRNLVYLFFVIIFVAIGFMIMFRSKLNPQTVVNIQLALPKIVIALILVTFSYALSGFIVDLVFFSNKVVSNIYALKLNASLPGGAPLTAESLNWLDIIAISGFGTFDSVLDNLAKVFSPGTLYDLLVTHDFSALFNIIVAFTIFGIALKIFFTLLSKYVTLLIQAIFSPFIFLGSAFPSSQGGLGNFFKSMLSAALAFPAIYFVFILANSFFSLPDPLISLPPLNNAGTLAAIGGLNKYIALGVLMTAPSIPQMIDGALGVKAPGVDMSQIGGALHKIPIIGSLIG
jgi:hypothetical protein